MDPDAFIALSKYREGPPLTFAQSVLQPVESSEQHCGSFGLWLLLSHPRDDYRVGWLTKPSVTNCIAPWGVYGITGLNLAASSAYHALMLLADHDDTAMAAASQQALVSIATKLVFNLISGT